MKQLFITIALIFSLFQVNAQTSTWDGTSSTWTNDWIPIGGRNMQGESSANAFAGVFDGNNKTISNLKINTPNKNNTGLFGYVESYSFNPEIRNLSVVSGTVNGNSSTGGVIGYLKGRVRNPASKKILVTHWSSINYAKIIFT